MVRPKLGDKVVFQVPVYGVGVYMDNGAVMPEYYVASDGSERSAIHLYCHKTLVYKVGEENIERMPNNGN